MTALGYCDLLVAFSVAAAVVIVEKGEEEEEKEELVRAVSG